MSGYRSIGFIGFTCCYGWLGKSVDETLGGTRVFWGNGSAADCFFDGFEQLFDFQGVDFLFDLAWDVTVFVWCWVYVLAKQNGGFFFPGCFFGDCPVKGYEDTDQCHNADGFQNQQEEQEDTRIDDEVIHSFLFRSLGICCASRSGGAELPVPVKLLQPLTKFSS